MLEGAMLNNILVPVDGSEHALKAIKLAGDLAEKYRSNLTVLHVRSKNVPEDIRIFAEMEFSAKERQDMGGILEKASEKVIKELIAEAKLVRSPQTLVLLGDPAAVIVEYAKKNDIDAVVMGSRGMSDLKGLLVGSVSHKVSNLVECTCIMVK